MAAIQGTQKQSNHLALVVVIIVIIIVLLVLPELEDLRSADSQSEIGELLSGVPMSNHAKTGHIGQPYNSNTIKTTFEKGGCKRVRAWVCLTPFEQCRIMCEIRTNVWAALVCSLDNCSLTMVVTGYQGSLDYWMRSNISDSCTEMSLSAR